MAVCSRMNEIIQKYHPNLDTNDETYTKLPWYLQPRVCNSDHDDDDDTTTSTCLPATFPYSEVRIVWSELLQVPTTMETSGPDRNVNFYHPHMPFDYGAQTYDWDALRVAQHVAGGGTCPKHLRQTNPKNNHKDWHYTSCGHVMPEVWSGQVGTYTQLTAHGLLEPPESTGVVGKLGWFVPKFVAQQDPSLTHWLGYVNPNRAKVANTFLTPTTFGDYCDHMGDCTNLSNHATLMTSNHNHHRHDNHHHTNTTTTFVVALRPPADDTEAGQYFVPGVYHGHFRPTDDSNCTAHPNTCVGDIADVPCDWTTFVTPQAHHLDIPVRSKGPLLPNSGYTYSQLLQIMQAAHATRSPLLLYWWYPDPTYERYMGTDFELQPVSLPPPNQECVTHRVAPHARCHGATVQEQVGAPEGACDAEPHSLLKMVITNLYRHIQGQDTTATTEDASDGSVDADADRFKTNPGAIPVLTHSDHFHATTNDRQQTPDEETQEALRSPAYDVLMSVGITELQLGEMIVAWQQTNMDPWNYDPRQAVCEWVVDNLPTLQTWIPRTYPRIMQEQTYVTQGLAGLFGTALALALFAGLALIVMALLVYKYRHSRYILMGQVGFAYFLLGGLFLIAIGSGCLALDPQDATCILQVWMINLGYTLELVPLIVKVAAIHKMIQAAKKMKRITIKKVHLYQKVAFFFTLITIFLIVWTVVDPPLRREQIRLEPELQTDSGETIVVVTFYCESEHYDLVWRYLSLGWQCILMLSATVLAFQTRNIRRDLNESHTLGMMIYSHFVFILLRCITYILEGVVEHNLLQACRSLIYSLDALVALNIYFTPKLVRVIKDKYFPKPADANGRNGCRQTNGGRREDSVRISGLLLEDDPSDLNLGNPYGSSHSRYRMTNGNLSNGSLHINSFHENASGPPFPSSETLKENSRDNNLPRGSYDGKPNTYRFTRPGAKCPAETVLSMKSVSAASSGSSSFLMDEGNAGNENSFASDKDHEVEDHEDDEIDVDEVSLGDLQRIQAEKSPTKTGETTEAVTPDLDVISSSSSSGGDMGEGKQPKEAAKDDPES